MHSPAAPMQRNRSNLTWACELLGEARIALERADARSDEEVELLARVDAMLCQASREIEALVAP